MKWTLQLEHFYDVNSLLNNYVVAYSFLFPLVWYKTCKKSTKKYGNYSENKVLRFYGLRCRGYNIISLQGQDTVMFCLRLFFSSISLIYVTTKLTRELTAALTSIRFFLRSQLILCVCPLLSFVDSRWCNITVQCVCLWEFQPVHPSFCPYTVCLLNTLTVFFLHYSSTCV